MSIRTPVFLVKDRAKLSKKKTNENHVFAFGW